MLQQFETKDALRRKVRSDPEDLVYRFACSELRSAYRQLGLAILSHFERVTVAVDSPLVSSISTQPVPGADERVRNTWLIYSREGPVWIARVAVFMARELAPRGGISQEQWAQFGVSLFPVPLSQVQSGYVQSKNWAGKLRKSIFSVRRSS